MKIIDSKGTWFQHTGEFRLPHPNGACFEPGEPTKILPDDYIAGQPTLVRIANPDETPDEKTQAKLDADNAKDEAARGVLAASARTVMEADNATMK